MTAAVDLDDDDVDEPTFEEVLMTAYRHGGMRLVHEILETGATRFLDGRRIRETADDARRATRKVNRR